jgi:hypothetical protein
MNPLQLPTGENILLSAFRAMAEGELTESTELVAEYERHFITAIPAQPAHPPVFERFSLVDPTIRMTVQSSTASA